MWIIQNLRDILKKKESSIKVKVSKHLTGFVLMNGKRWKKRYGNGQMLFPPSNLEIMGRIMMEHVMTIYTKMNILAFTGNLNIYFF